MKVLLLKLLVFTQSPDRKVIIVFSFDTKYLTITDKAFLKLLPHSGVMQECVMSLWLFNILMG